MRVSNRMMHADVLANLQAHAERLTELRTEISSGKRVRNPSDDPFAAGQALTLRDSLAVNETHLENNTTVSAWLGATEVGLRNLADITEQALNIARRAGSDDMGENERASFSTQVTHLIEEALDALNTGYQDQYLFAGYKTTGSTKPFTLATGSPDTVTYNGDAGLRNVEVEPPGRTITMNVTGLLASGAQRWTAANTLFPNLITLRDALATPSNGATIRTQIGALQTDLQTTLNTITDIGARQQRLDRTSARVENVQIVLEGFLSEVENASLAETIVELQAEESAYQASLNTAARLSTQSLFDFLRSPGT